MGKTLFDYPGTKAGSIPVFQNDTIFLPYDADAIVRVSRYLFDQMTGSLAL